MNFCKLLQERAESLVNAGRYRDYNLDLLLTKFGVRTVCFGQSFFRSDFWPRAKCAGHKFQPKSEVRTKETRLIAERASGAP